MANNFLAFYGSPGSGKTTLAVKTAKALSLSKKNVIIVGCDDETPLLPVLMPKCAGAQSIGELLSMPDITEIDILRHCTPFGKSKYIGLLGYRLGESAMSYPEYKLKQAQKLYRLLCSTADYVIADCSSHLSNYLTAAALMTADVTVKVLNADLKSMAYVKSQEPLLQDRRYRYEAQVNVFNNVPAAIDISPIEAVIGNAAYVFPSVPALKEQYGKGEMLETVFGKNAKQFEMEINIFAKEVFNGQGAIPDVRTADKISGVT